MLQQRGLSFEAVAVGGSSLMLLGWINRPTRDLDLAALVQQGEYVTADPLPAALADSADWRPPVRSLWRRHGGR